MTTNRSALAPPPVLGEEIAALAGRDLPHGPVPPALDAVTTEAEPRLSERVRALVANARATEERTPLMAAICWHEAGRLLAGRAGRPGEAWLCHSRALAVHPEHQPARRALRRLATSAGDAGLLVGILDAEIGAATDAFETAALLVERAGAETALGQPAAALGTLREAAGIQPRSLVPYLLQLAVTTSEAGDAELADTLRALVDGWPVPEAGVRLMLGLLEERLGRHDAALARLVIGAGGEIAPPDGASAWATARLALHAGQPELAARSIETLARTIRPGQGSADLAQALDRFRATVQALATDLESSAGVGTGTDIATAEPGLIVALRSADFQREARLLGTLAAAVSTPGIRAALLASAAATGLAAGSGGGEPPGEVGALGLQGGIIERLLSPGPAGIDNPAAPDEPPETGIHRALRQREPSRVAAAFDALRDRGADEDERWNLAVAAAWLRDERLGAPEEATRGLLAATDAMDRSPLPRLIRARVSDHARLAELALVEADHAGDPACAALRLAWAGHHLGQIDPARGADLHRRALEIDPACPLALAALSRGTVDHAALAEARTSAATEADGDQRFRHLLRAGAHRLAMGATEQAALAFGQALDLDPEDVDLRAVLLRLSLDRPAAATARLMELSGSTDGLQPRMLMALGSLALGLDPAVAVEAFSMALALDPTDPIARQGQIEALLADGRGSLVSADLLERLGRTEEPEERARLLLRLAEIDSRHGKDWTSAVLSLLSLNEIMPGHRPTLVGLALHYSRHGRHDDLVRVLADLARAVDDDADGAALAQLAWQGTAADLDLLRLAVNRGSATPIQLVQLEALSDSPAERLGLLRAISDGLGGSPLRLLRLADALEEAGDFGGALETVGRAVAGGGHDVATLAAALRLRRATGDLAGQAEDLAALARSSEVPAHRVEYLLAQARLAQGGLGDSSRAAACCLAALEADPGCEEAYRMGRALLEELGDRPGLAALVTQRIRGSGTDTAKHGLLLELAEIRLTLGEADGAKIALGLALELVPGDVPTRRRLAGLHTRDGEWDAAIEHLTESARLNRDPAAGQEIFFDLGVLYAERTDRIDLAEKSFVKVLGWNRGHFSAMERLADVYARMGNWQRAAQALERLVVMADSPAVKAAKMVALAAVVDTRLARPVDAERLLSEARGIEPLGLEPIRGLAELYTRQQDGMALNVLLDQTLAGHAAALEADPDQPRLYANVFRILEMKTEDSLASLAAGVLDLLGARGDFPDVPPDVVEVHWPGGARAGDASLAEFFCPKAIPPGLRETLRAVEEPIARSLGASARQVDLPRDSRLDRKHPLALMLNLLGPAFGIRGEITCHAVATPGIRFAPGAPGIALVPEGIARGEEPAAIAFAAGSILACAREGLALATIVTEDRLRRLVAGLVRLAVPGYAPAGIEPGELDEEVAFLRRALPDKVVARVAQFAFECGSALERPALRRNLITIAHRIGFLTTGSLTGALGALAVEHGRPPTPLAPLPGSGSLISFAFSKDHLELRRRMGL